MAKQFHWRLLHDTLRFMHNPAASALPVTSDDWDDLRFVLAVADCGTVSAQGNASAQNNLGVMYYQGQGVTQDYVRAHMWFNLSAASDTADAVKNRDIVARKMTSQQIAQAQIMARDCQQKNFKGCE